MPPDIERQMLTDAIRDSLTLFRALRDTPNLPVAKWLRYQVYIKVLNKHLENLRGT